MTTTICDLTVPAADGVALRGDLHLPDADGPAPGIVMTHGFSATRHMGLAGFATAFADAGLAVLVYDHRNLGASDGEPRGEIDPWAQVADTRTALAWLADRPEVDGERLGLWGSSYSGGEAIALAAVDRRVRAVVANVPFAGLGDLDPDDVEAIEARWARVSAVIGGEAAPPPSTAIGPMAVVLEPGGDDAAFLPQPESSEWFLAAADASWRNRFTLRHSDDPPFDPFVCVHHVAPTPLLMVVASEDRVAPAATALAAFEAAGEPKQLEVVPGHHFGDYAGPEHERAAAVMRDFYLAHL